MRLIGHDRKAQREARLHDLGRIRTRRKPLESAQHIDWRAWVVFLLCLVVFALIASVPLFILLWFPY